LTKLSGRELKGLGLLMIIQTNPESGKNSEEGLEIMDSEGILEEEVSEEGEEDSEDGDEKEKFIVIFKYF